MGGGGDRLRWGKRQLQKEEITPRQAETHTGRDEKQRSAKEMTADRERQAEAGRSDSVLCQETASQLREET